MGKKCKKKVQWRRLLLNEPPTKSLSDDGCEEDCDDDEERSKSSCNVPTSHQRPQGLHPRRPFHPNFYPGDQRRFPPPVFDSRGPPFDKETLPDRYHHPRFFERPFHYDQRPPFPGLRRKPFKFFGRGCFYVRGPSSYSGNGDASRQQSEEEGGLVLEVGREEGVDETEDGGEKPLQLVHTVLIDNEEYTKIQTPRQEVIFKKSSLDRKRDSIDLGLTLSSCGSTSGCDRNSQGDQGSVAGSVEDSASSPYEESQQESSTVDQNPYEGDSSNIFMGEPGKPPLAGVVMQQAYPGGPMISIPVHWTPFLDPGLIPGDTALTPLDPAFTHVIDPKDLPVDPAHILPVQHDSSGCPVTVQVKVNADGLPIEIEPSAFTVSLNTLEPHQQEILLRGRPDIASTAAVVPQVAATPFANSVHSEKGKDVQTEGCAGKNGEEEEEHCDTSRLEQMSKERDYLEKSGQEHKDSEDSYSDSQYASMSESSTAPTTPSVELSESSSDSSKSRNNKSATEICPEEDLRRVSRSDSLLDSASMVVEGSDEPCSCNSLSSDTNENPVKSHSPDTLCIIESTSSVAAGGTHPRSESKVCSSPFDLMAKSSLTSSPSASESVLKQESDSTSIFPSDSQDSVDSSKTNDTNKKKNKKSKKSRSFSSESSVSSQNSSFGDAKGNGHKTSNEISSKYQAKKSAKLLKKDKKRLRKEKIKGKKSAANVSKVSRKTEADVSPSDSQESLSVETKSQDLTVFIEEKKSKNLFRTESTEESSLESVPRKKELALEASKFAQADDPDIDVRGSQIATKTDPVKEEVMPHEGGQRDNEQSVENAENLKTLKTEKSRHPDAKTSEDSKTKSLEDFETKISEDWETKTSEDSKTKASEDSEAKTSENSEAKTSEDSEAKTSEDIEVKTSEDSEAKTSEDSEAKTSEDSEAKTSEDSEAKTSEDSEIKKDKLEEGLASSSTEQDEKDSKDPSILEEGDGGDFICKPGFVMVPILTPYYDPAILYGYPLVIPENLPERSYTRKKKKKWKKKYQEDICLDTDLFVGEPFVATPNGYILPSEASQVCHMHGYQYLPGMFPPHMLPDEGFVSVDQSPYLSEFVPEPTYCSRPSYDEMEAYTKSRFSRLYEEERKEIKEVLHDHPSFKGNKKAKDFNESCDSGVSESEELNQLMQGKDLQGDGDAGKDGLKESKKNKEKTNSPKNLKKGGEKSQNVEKEEKSKMKKDTKKKGKPRKKEKGRKEKIEILEPDFSSFSGPTLRFKSKQEKETPSQQNSTKITKNRRKKSVKTPSPRESVTPDASVAKSADVASKSISDQNTLTVCDTNRKDKMTTTTTTARTKSKKYPEVKTDPESQAETMKTDTDSTKTKVRQESTSGKSKRSKGNRRRSKASKKVTAAKDCNNGAKNENKTSLSTASECLISNESLNNKLPDEDRQSLESENATVSEEWLSQESENIPESDDILSQESEILLNDVCHSQESESISARDESLNLQSEKSTTTIKKCPDQKEETETLDSICEGKIIEETTVTYQQSFSPSLGHETPTHTTESEAEPTSSEPTESPDSSLVQIPSSSTLVVSDEFPSSSPTSSLRCNKTPALSSRENMPSVTSIPEEKSFRDRRSPLPDGEEPTQSYTDLGVTEAVKRWIREVTPEKAFALSHKTRSLLLNSVVSPDDSEDDDQSSYVSEDVDISDYPEQQEPKNVQGNPSVASPSETSRGVSSERVAASVFSDDAIMTSCHDATPFRGLDEVCLRTSSSQDVLDDYDGESVFSGLSRGPLYSSSSSSFPLGLSHLEDATLIEDPRVYDPTVYSKYYQLGVDVCATPSSNPFTRESTLSPPPLESVFEDVSLFPDDEGLATPSTFHCMSLATELYKSQKIGTSMSHISPSLRENPLPLPHCGYPWPNLGKEVHQEGEEAEEAESCDGERSLGRKHVSSYSVSSSGIGSSLASTPNLSPAHQPRLSHDHTNARPKLEPYPLKNLSVGEGSMPCKAACCSVM